MELLNAIWDLMTTPLMMLFVVFPCALKLTIKALR